MKGMTMRRITVLVTALALLAFTAAPAMAEREQSRMLTAELSGENEVPAVESEGQGIAIFNLSRDGITYKLAVENIDEVTQAHIHLGPAGENGPVVAFLFGFVEGGVTADGVLARGTITEADLVGPLAGMPLSALVEALRNGGAYVNVHTVDHPAGEIRGQIG
jgi:ABC-type nitrate/sulfonate/bicarbonate transport system substrate-binding protein